MAALEACKSTTREVTKLITAYADDLQSKLFFVHIYVYLFNCILGKKRQLLHYESNMDVNDLKLKLQVST